MYFITLVILVIAQRLYELKVANKNSQKILAQGGVEFGANHYWMIVLLHAFFFASLILESIIKGIHPPSFCPIALIIFLFVQVIRVWVIKSMNGRWTTRILVIPKETFVSDGPFKFIAHPNYTVVAIELFIFPLIFGLTITSFIFTFLNAILILSVRIPEEERAIRWAKCPSE